MQQKNNHSLQTKLFFGIGALFLFVVGTIWLFQMPSAEEAFGDTGKFSDILQTYGSGWTPMFMLGHSTTIYQITVVDLFLHLINIFRFWVELLTVTKILGIAYLSLSGVTMFLFVRRLTRDEIQAAISALAYLMMPSITVEMGIYEHFSVTLCYVFMPLILRGILVLSEEKSMREIIVLGLAASAMALSYTKMAVVIAPLLLLWTLEILRLQPRQSRLTIISSYGISAGIAALLTFPFLLPASREFGFAAGFLFDPLDSWQHHYAFKSALQWIDLWGFFMRGGGADVERDAVMFAIGLIPLLAISFGLGLAALEEWRRSLVGRWFLMLVACWLLSISLAAGPDGILLGHWHLLKNNAHDMADVAIPCLWLALAWLAWMSLKVIHYLIGGAPWRSWFLLALFLATPLFRIVGAFPLFNDIRAPQSFWSVGGFCALAAAVGMVTVAIFTKVISSRWRVIAAIGVGFLFLLELYPIHSAYWTRGLPEELFADYDQSITFLKNASLPGRVYAISSRYFYLTIPQKTGHGLSTESLLRHFELKWVRHFEIAGMTNIDMMKTYLNLAGVSYIFIDKEDPLTPKQTQDSYRALFPVVFENRSIVILMNVTSLYPAFLARNFVALSPESYQMAPMTLQLAQMNFLAVELGPNDQSQIGFAGRATGNNRVDLLPQYQKSGGAPFLRVLSAATRSDDYGKMIYHLPPTASGWLTVSEAFHPDWQAFIDGQPTPIHRAASALMGVYVPLGSQEIIFKFVPPAWYAISFYLGCLLWIVALGGFLFCRTHWVPPAWKEWWNRSAERISKE